MAFLYLSGYESTCVKFLQVLIFIYSRFLPLNWESLEFLGFAPLECRPVRYFSGFEKAHSQGPTVMEAGSGPGVGVRRHLRKSLANRGKHPSVVWLGRIVSPGCDNRHCHADQKDLLTSHYMCFNE